MTTAIATIDRKNFLALGDSAELREALDATAEAGETFGPGDLIRVPMPAGGATQWAIPGISGDESTPEIVGILVYYQPCGILWPSSEPLPGALPVLRTWEPTNPAAVAEQVGPIPDTMLAALEKCRIDDRHFRWADLPYNQWGSGRAGQGKLCKEQRILFVLREGDVFPLVVTAQPGSLKNVTRFFKMLTSTARVPYWRCVVGLKLEKAVNKGGQPFSRIAPRLAGILDAETGEVVKTMWRDKLAAVAKRMEDVPAVNEEE